MRKFVVCLFSAAENAVNPGPGETAATDSAKTATTDMKRLFSPVERVLRGN